MTTLNLKWITIVEQDYAGKTRKFTVVTNDANKFILGEIKWYGPFRKYSFFPNGNTVFEATCMSGIVNFMNELMAERKHANQTNPSNWVHENKDDKGEYKLK